MFEKYGKRRKVGGPYHTVAALKRAIEQHLERMDAREGISPSDQARA